MQASRLLGAILGVAATAAAPPSAEQAKFCAEVDEIVAAAREAGPFASFPRSRTMEGRRMLGFGVCGRDEQGFSCWGYGDPQPWSSVEELAAMVERCLPEATVSDGALRVNEARRVLTSGSHTIFVDSGALRFELVFTFTSRTNATKLLAYHR